MKKGTNGTSKTFDGFSDDERAAMKEHARELKAAGRRGATANEETDVLAKIAEMPDADRALAERVHAIVTAAAPELSPKTWYGMPAYARGGAIVCHFQPAAKFKTRYATLTFADKANLDDGSMWPVSYALTEITAQIEARITDLVTRAVS